MQRVSRKINDELAQASFTLSVEATKYDVKLRGRRSPSNNPGEKGDTQ